MLRKFLGIIILICLGVIAIYVIYWEFWSTEKYKISSGQGLAQLSFTSLYGDYLIFIDGNLIDQVASKESKQFESIPSGRRNVKITRKSSVQNLYYTLERYIMFETGTQVEIKWEAGPTLESSRGIIKYFRETYSPDGIEVYVQPIWPNSIVYLNSTQLHNNYAKIKNPGVLRFRVVNGDMFDPLEFEISIENESQGNIKNLAMIIEVFLYKKPIKF